MAAATFTHWSGFIARAALVAFAAGILLTSQAGTASIASSGPVTFTHYWTGSLSGGIDALVSKHNELNPGAGLVASGMEHESFKSAIKALLAGGAAPDIFSYWAGARTRALVQAGYLEPLDDLWLSQKLDRLFTPAVADACEYGGKKYAVPVTQHFVAFFYNKEIFKRLGLSVPATWDQFLAVCQTLSTRGVTPLALGIRERWPAQFWFDYLLLRTAGPEYRGRLMNGQASYEDPEVKRVFTLWKELVDKNYFNADRESLDWAEAARQVREGRAAMTLMGTWIIGLYDGKLGWTQEKDYDFFVFPVLDPSVPVVSMGPIDVLVMKKSSDAQRAKRALGFFAQAEPQEAMSRGSGALAPNIEVPGGFYTGLQKRVLAITREAKRWAFAYDLATPPEVAMIGLGCFYAFMRSPADMQAILSGTQQKARDVFRTLGQGRDSPGSHTSLQGQAASSGQ